MNTNTLLLTNNNTLLLLMKNYTPVLLLFIRNISVFRQGQRRVFFSPGA